MLSARFDDLRIGRKHAFGFGEPSDTIIATRIGDVVKAIEKADVYSQQGKWLAGWVSYEAANALDPGLRTADPSDFPKVAFNVYEDVVSNPSLDGFREGRVDGWRPNVDEPTYASHIDTIRERIRQGDTYQVNYTLRMHGHVQGAVSGLYANLVRAQSGGYGARVRVGDWEVASASPELFFEWDHDGSLTTRPMKGTTRRGRTTAEDAALVAELVASDKERAENVMIVDLIRNDLGRVSTFGSVEVTELFAVEQYNTVWQMTSEVVSQARPDATLLDVFQALFPSGSVTGAPKTATMGIIADLERTPRNVYCGAIGVLAPPDVDVPRARFNVPIRTVLVNHATGTAEYGVGGGITYDSTSGGEYAEAMLKTEVLNRPAVDYQLIETMLWEDGSVWLLDRHLERLSDSASYLGLHIDLPAIRKALLESEFTEPARMRLVVDDGDWTLSTEPYQPGLGPIRLAIDTARVHSSDWRLFHKTTARTTYEEARNRFPDVDDVVLVNQRGHVTETTIANLAIRTDQGWITPPLDDGLLPGVYRTELLTNGALIERSISVDEFASAQERAVFNSVRGWVPATIVPE